ncbi:hypothetical protein NliqN6_6491 [Naganishia liquefaciens]|uniref:Uncharacterized protein n=1 Tax=Naganishia liquefaciens TaxID=104408 RepID=A0A8H3TZR4_9TREE|nr:hypothetical protein NliqN6_6491 [Naganishia liquefaciens]
MSSAPVVYEIPFTQAYYHKGVDLSPEEHAQSRLAELRRACLNVAMLDPKVGSARFGTVVDNGVGNEWRIEFSTKDYRLDVQYDIKRKDPITRKRTRKIGYILHVTVVQQNIPNAGQASEPPRQILVSLK